MLVLLYFRSWKNSIGSEHASLRLKEMWQIKWSPALKEVFLNILFEIHTPYSDPIVIRIFNGCWINFRNYRSTFLECNWLEIQDNIWNNYVSRPFSLFLSCQFSLQFLSASLVCHRKRGQKNSIRSHFPEKSRYFSRISVQRLSPSRKRYWGISFSKKIPLEVNLCRFCRMSIGRKNCLHREEFSNLSSS